MMAPWLSIIMPVFNGGELLRHALESVCAQDDRDVEVIVVDDGSTDGSREMAQSFAGRVPLRTIALEHTGNWVAVANRGYALAQGEFIQTLHQDDGWCPGRLRAVRDALCAEPASVLLTHPVYFVDRDGRRLGRSASPFGGRAVVPGAALVERLLVTNFITVCSAVYRREALYSAGLMNETLWYSADWDLWLKLARLGTTICLDLPLSEVRIHGGSQTATRAAHAPDLREQQEIVFADHWAKWSDQIPADRRAMVHAVGRLSIDLNVALARGSAGRFSPATLAQLGLQFAALGPRGWGRFFSDARLVQRCWPRIRARLSETM